MEELIDIKTGNKNAEDANEEGQFNFYVRSQQVLKSREYTFDDEGVIFPGEGIFIPHYAKGKFAVHQRVYFLKTNNKEKLLNKYFYYWISSNTNQITKGSVGSTVASLRISSFTSPYMFLPNVQIQKQIIDIIEPHEQLFLRLSKCVRIDTAEHAKNDIKSLIDIIEPIEQLKNKLKLINKKIFQIAKIISSDYHFKERMKNKCKFIKGLNTKNFEIGETLFLNVSAANFKPNKYCNNKPNIHFGDITLSLDGTTGIVSKSLVGFNGYLYKIISNSYKNYEIYYSLLTNENQAIIKLNETGTTIKHSPNSKSQLWIYKFKKNQSLKWLFEQSVKIEKTLPYLIKLKAKLINLLIK